MERTHITIQEKLAILKKYYDERPTNKAQFARESNIKEQTFYGWLKKDFQELENKSRTLDIKNAKNLATSQYPILDEALYQWFVDIRAASPRFPVNDAILHFKANVIARRLGIKRLPAVPKKEQEESLPHKIIPQFDGLNDEATDDSYSELFDNSTSDTSELPLEPLHDPLTAYPCYLQPPAGITIPPDKTISSIVLPQLHQSCVINTENVLQPHTDEQNGKLNSENPSSPQVATSSYNIREHDQQVYIEDPETDYTLEIINRTGEIVSKSWIRRWKKRRGIVYKDCRGEAADSDHAAGDRWVQQTLHQLISEYGTRNIFNVDETGLFWRQLPTKTLCLTTSERNTRTIAGSKLRKDRVTVLLGGSIEGEPLVPFIIAKEAYPPGITQDTLHPFIYRQQANAWMTCSLFEEWLSIINRLMVATNRYVAIVTDNCSAHRTTRTYSNLRIIFLPPLVTATHQPMDAGLIAVFKRHYKTLFLLQLFTIRNNLSLLNFKMKDCCKTIVAAWKRISTSIIKACFSKAWKMGAEHSVPASGETVIIPTEEKEFIDEALQELQDKDEDCHIIERRPLDLIIHTAEERVKNSNPIIKQQVQHSDYKYPFNQVYQAINIIDAEIKALGLSAGPQPCISWNLVRKVIFDSRHNSMVQGVLHFEKPVTVSPEPSTAAANTNDTHLEEKTAQVQTFQSSVPETQTNQQSLHPPPVPATRMYSRLIVKQPVSHPNEAPVRATLSRSFQPSILSFYPSSAKASLHLPRKSWSHHHRRHHRHHRHSSSSSCSKDSINKHGRDLSSVSYSSPLTSSSCQSSSSTTIQKKHYRHKYKHHHN